MTRRRGDNIPSISDYAHWNEEAEAMWYAENRYDMEHADEIIEDDNDRYDSWEPDPFQSTFNTEAEARAFMTKYDIDEHRDTLSQWGRPGEEKWYVEHYSKEGHRARPS